MVLQMPAGPFYTAAWSPHVPAQLTVLAIRKPEGAASATPPPQRHETWWVDEWSNTGGPLQPHAWVDDADGFAGLLKTSVVDRVYLASRGWGPWWGPWPPPIYP